MDSIVRGEASETDEENQLDAGVSKKLVLASEVKGEATESESDEEIFEKPSGSVSTSMYSNNILQQKLISSNLEIWKRLRSIAREYVTPSSKTLINCDHLVRTELITMQSTLQSLKKSNENTKRLQEKIGCLFPNNFIPDIKIERKKFELSSTKEL